MYRSLMIIYWKGNQITNQLKLKANNLPYMMQQEWI